MVIIVPWAASVVMTSTVFVYGLDPFYGIINKFLVDVGIIDEPYGFLKNATAGFLSAMAVAVFVSVPFSTFVVLAGLQTVPHDVLEAAQIDGAGRVQTYWRVVFPMLRPALAVAAIINIINVFNSLPILKTMTGAIPGNDADTTTSLMFKIIQNDRQIDTASALSVLNFVVILVVIGIYLKVVKPMREVSA
jgi:multiple sugar transport system permease protein